jgi:hypothetical protein
MFILPVVEVVIHCHPTRSSLAPFGCLLITSSTVTLILFDYATANSLPIVEIKPEACNSHLLTFG